MTGQSLNGTWKLCWSTGQRGGTPYVLKHPDDREWMWEIRGKKRTLPGRPENARWMEAAVPGEVHLDLLREGVLDDPYVRGNVLKARWVEECVWHYYRVFTPSPEALQGRACLRFDGLSLTAIVYLNGEEIARHSNSFYPLIIDVTGRLREGENELLVRLESGLFEVCDRPIRDSWVASGTVDILLHKRLWMRCPQSHTEWDWSPRLLNVGIQGGAALLSDPQAVITDAAVSCEVRDDLSAAAVRGRVFPAPGTRAAGRFTLELTVGDQTVSRELDGLSEEPPEAELTVERPRLWYPAGYGDQPLYPVALRLRQGDRVVYEKRTQTGFRHVRVDQSPHPQGGRYFVVHINGLPVFLKGANLVPADMITAAITPQRYETLVDRALEAHFNALRVWGGGLYEAEEFYDLCNRRGILVWQEFISACGDLPVEDDGLREDMIREIRYQARRLSRHPSLFAWCGNNEIPPYGIDWYMDTLPMLIHREDPEKYYQPSSPYTDPEGAASADIWEENSGDQHPWSVGFLNKDHRDYRRMVCRFPNEGGILGPVSLPTMLDCVKPGEGYSRSFAWQVHDNMLAFQKDGSSPDDDTDFWLRLRPEDLTLEEYVFAGGFVQGEGLSDYADNFRRRMFDSACAIFWMYNDCWPCVRSWTIVDYRLNRTPGFYPVKRAFAPVRVVLAEEEGGAAVYGVNGTLEPVEAVLRFGAFRCGGSYLRDESREVILPPNGSIRLAWFDGWREEPPAVPFALLTDAAGRELSRNRLLTHRYWEYPLRPAALRRREAEGRTVWEADGFVLGVCLDLDGVQPLPDNLFDVFPGIPTVLEGSGLPPVRYTVNDLLIDHGVTGNNLINNKQH